MWKFNWILPFCWSGTNWISAENGILTERQAPTVHELHFWDLKTDTNSILINKFDENQQLQMNMVTRVSFKVSVLSISFCGQSCMFNALIATVIEMLLDNECIHTFELKVLN